MPRPLQALRWKMNIKIRKEIIEDSNPIFSLLENFATSFNPEKPVFEHSLEVA
jgi:hypothetical protein